MIINNRSIRSAVVFALFLCAVLTEIAATGEAVAVNKSLTLKPDQELNLIQTSEGKINNLRLCSDYFCVEFADYRVFLVCKAPQWNVRIIAPVKKLYFDMPLQDWVRRGSPLNFLHVTSVPEWPTVRVGQQDFLNLRVTKFALPYKVGQRTAALSKGTVGQVLSLTEGAPPAAGMIMETFYHTPKVPGLPLTTSIWDFDKQSGTMSSMFLYSGGTFNSKLDLKTSKSWISKRSPLPSIAGFKVAATARDIWVNQADARGFEDLMR